MKQYFYLVAYHYDECTVPRKIFLQEHDAITWGRREATVHEEDPNYEYVLYKQSITRTGELKKVKTLLPYHKESKCLTLVCLMDGTKLHAVVEKLGVHSNMEFARYKGHLLHWCGNHWEEDNGNYGSDFDIDKERC